MKLPKSTYDITYQYLADGASLLERHTHSNMDPEGAEMLLRFFRDINRNCRVRQNATGRIVEVAVAGKEPLTLLNLFFKSISGRCGKATDK